MKKPDVYVYPAVFSYEPGESEIAVVFPDLNVATSGEDEVDALHMARELLGLVMYGLEEDGEDIPTPSHLKDIKASDNKIVALVDVFMPSVRMAEINRSVNRTVTLPAWLNALAMEKGVNFSAVLQEGLKAHLGV